MKLKCLIIDDEPVAREGLKVFIEKVDYLELAGILPHALQAGQFLKNHSIDLLFLDIEMPDLDGLAFLRSLTHKPLVVLTTAHRKYAVEGFELDVIDYLMKPITFERFIKATNKVLEIHMTHQQENTSTETYFFIKTDKQYIKIDYSDIIYVESARDYVLIYTQNARHLALLSLIMVEEQLPKDQFMRVHRSYLVSISNIEVVEGNRIFIGKKEIPISRNLREEVYDKLIHSRLWKRNN